MKFQALSHDITSGSDIMPCNKNDKPLDVYEFSNVTQQVALKMTKTQFLSNLNVM